MNEIRRAVFAAQQGQNVLFVGFPRGNARTLARGLLSVLGPNRAPDAEALRVLYKRQRLLKPPPGLERPFLPLPVGGARFDPALVVSLASTGILLLDLARIAPRMVPEIFEEQEGAPLPPLIVGEIAACGCGRDEKHCICTPAELKRHAQRIGRWRKYFGEVIEWGGEA